jgi:TonB family protein
MDMKKLLLITSLCTALSSKLYAIDPDNLSLHDGSAMALYGLGLYQDLSADVYLGAVYVRPEAPEIKAGRSRKMEMRILSDSISGRKFSRLWLDAITLSSSREQRTQQAEQIQKFGEIYKDNLVKGDHIGFDYLEGDDKTVFLLNDVVLDEVKGEALYNILLNCWIGSTPLSEQFKAGIMKQLDATLASQYKTTYAGLVFSKARYDEINKNSGFQKKQQEKQAAQEREKQAEQEREQQEALAKEQKASAQPPQPVDNTVAKTTLDAELIRKEAEKIVREKEEVERLVREKAEAERLVLEKEKMAAEQEELRKEYFAQLSKWINQHAIYPERAEQKKLEGKVRLRITSDRLGKIVNVTVQSSSGIEELDEAVVKMVKAKAEPLPKMPEKLVGDTFDFTMPLSFSMGR